MAEDVELGIRIGATGGDTAAAEIAKTTDAMKGLGDQSEAIRGQFQQRFEHIGLRLFAGDLLRSTGLARDARGIFSLLQLSLMEASSAFGLAAGGAMLYVTAAAALVAVVVKITQHHKDQIEVLEKSQKLHEENAKSLSAEYDALTKYAQLTGQMTPSMQALADATKAAADASFEKARADSVALAEAKAALVMRKEDEIKSLQDAAGAENVRIVAVNQGITIEQARQEVLAKTAGKIKDLQDAVIKLKQEEADQVQKAIDAGNHESRSWGERAEAATKAVEQQDNAYMKSLENKDKAMFASWEKAIKADDEYFANLGKKEESVFKKSEEMYKRMFSEGASAFSALGGAFNSSIAKMIVEGESFDQSFTKGIIHVKEMFIEAVESMIEKWLAFKAITGIAGAVGGPLGSALTSIAGFGGPQAAGGDYMVNAPTMFIAGEAGPERATFTPLNAPATTGAAGNGQGVQIGSIIMNVSGAQDPRVLADQLGREIVRMIRGSGQLNFARSF